MSESPSAERHYELLTKYFVPDMGDYTAIGGVLSSILDRLDKHKALSPEDKAFIRAKGLFDLCEFVKRLEETNRQDFLRRRLHVVVSCPWAGYRTSGHTAMLDPVRSPLHSLLTEDDPMARSR